jgi:signal transduction histidine kinase
VDLEFSAPRLPTETETTAYFIVAEALANVVKHAASQARVRIDIDALSLIVEVSDDGAGGPMPPAAARRCGHHSPSIRRRPRSALPAAHRYPLLAGLCLEA